MQFSPMVVSVITELGPIRQPLAMDGFSVQVCVCQDGHILLQADTVSI